MRTTNVSPKMLVVAPAAFLSSTAIGVVNLGMLFIIKELYGASASQIGWLGALWSTSYFCGCFVFKRLTARLVPRNSMTVMQAGGSLIMGLFLLRPGLLNAFVAVCLYGFITAFFWPPLMGWLSRNAESKALSKATSIFNFSWSLGAVISPYLAGLLSERDKFLPIALAAVLFGVNALFIQLSRLFIKDAGEQGGRTAEARNGVVDKSTPLRFPAWVGVFVTYMVMGVVFNVFPVYARDVLGISESATGFMLTLRALLTMTGFTLLGRFSQWQFKAMLIPVLSLLMTAIVLILIFAQSTIAYTLCFSLFGLLMAMVYNNSLFYSTSGALDRDKRANTHEALLTGGQVIGSVSGGFLYQLVSLPPVFMMLAGILALGAVSQIMIIKKTSRSAGN